MTEQSKQFAESILNPIKELIPAEQFDSIFTTFTSLVDATSNLMQQNQRQTMLLQAFLHKENRVRQGLKPVECYEHDGSLLIFGEATEDHVCGEHCKEDSHLISVRTPL